MNQSSQGNVRGYLLACVAVAAAGLAIHLLQAVGYTGFSPLFAGLIVTAWYGGIGPAVLGIILTTLTAYYVLPKGNDGQLYHEDFLRASVFTLTAMVAVAVHLAARRTEVAAKRDKHAAEKDSAAKTRLLAMVSHDLRGPLNPILMAVAAAESDPIVAERAKEPLRLIRSAVTEEVQLIEDLLDVARFATGKFTMKMAPVDLHAAIDKAILSSRESAVARKIEIDVDLTATATSVIGDIARLQQVLWNLLSNAIKFTPTDGRIAVRSFDSPEGWIGIEIKDSGVGISADKLPFIFNMFEQGGTDVTARFGGLGLGLTICRGIIEAHGGTITASSPGEGQGATFTVRLPLFAQLFHAATPLASSTPESPISRNSI